MTGPTLDEWQQVVNGEDSYDAIAEQLIVNGSCIAAWTDRKNIHYDVLFTMSPASFGYLQWGIRGYGYLYVSVMRRGCFAFRMDRNEDLFPSYVGEKLSEDEGASLDALTELINGVMKRIKN